MKRLLYTFMLLALIFSACRERVTPPGSYGQTPQNSDEIPEFNINDTANFNILGSYKITLMEIDSDSSIDIATHSKVTQIMSNVHITENGEDDFVQAAITSGQLTFNSDGTYQLRYKIENASKQDVEIGKFSEGAQSGEFEMLGSILSFTPYNTTPGFGEFYTTTYIGQLQNGTLMLTSVNQQLSEEYLLSIKASVNP